MMIIMMSPLQCQQPSSSSPPGFLDSGTNSGSSSESPNRFRPRVLGSEQRHLGIPHICQENTHHPNLFSEVVIGSAEVANQVLPVRFSEICCEKPFCLLYVCLHLSKALKICLWSFVRYLLLFLPDEVWNPRNLDGDRLLGCRHVTLQVASAQCRWLPIQRFSSLLWRNHPHQQ